MGYHVARPDELEYDERPSASGDVVRRVADLTTAVGLTQSRARLWRLPPGSRGMRHRDLGQEEVFVVVEGTLTMVLGEPPERVEVPAGAVAAVESGTPLQLRNESAGDVVLFAYGAPPVTGQVEQLDDPGDSF